MGRNPPHLTVFGAFFERVPPFQMSPEAGVLKLNICRNSIPFNPIQDESEIDLEMPKEWNGAAKWRDDIAVVDGSEIHEKQWDKGRNYLLTGAGFYFFCSRIRHVDGQVIWWKKIFSWDGVEVKSTEQVAGGWSMIIHAWCIWYMTIYVIYKYLRVHIQHTCIYIFMYIYIYTCNSHRNIYICLLHYI